MGTGIGTATAAADLGNFFTGAEARIALWRQLIVLARGWAAAGSGDARETALRTETTRLLDDVKTLETYWAYPGPRLIAALDRARVASHAVAFASLAQHICTAVVTSSYRHDGAAWDPQPDGDRAWMEALPPHVQVDGHKPYFEVLVVTPTDRGGWDQARQALWRLRAPHDAFHYEAVPVSTFDDALLAAVLNDNLQAVVLYEDLHPATGQEAPTLRAFLRRHFDSTAAAGITSVADAIKQFRPELDLHVVSGSTTLAQIHRSILDGVDRRYATPCMSSLRRHAHGALGMFHPAPIARGKSVFRSNWIRDMEQYYGTNLFLAESSATAGLDLLGHPDGAVAQARAAAARAFGAPRAFFVAEGTSTSIAIAVHTHVRPDDIVVLDRGGHQSQHYALVHAGAQPLYVDAFAAPAGAASGAVPLRTLKRALLDCRAEGTLDRVKLVILANCTSDGYMYDTARVMEECLAIKPDLVFLWDEASFGFARFNPFHRRRTAMGAAAALTARWQQPGYRDEYATFAAASARLGAADPALLDMRLLPDPDKARVRVWQVNSPFKSMSALRQGSVMAIWDDDWSAVEDAFAEAFTANTTTSPNAQILGSLDVARRQMELEGYELTMSMIELALAIRRDINSHPLVSKYLRVATPEDLVPAEFRRAGSRDYGRPHATWTQGLDAWTRDELALDPTRLTLICGASGLDGAQFGRLLAERFGVYVCSTTWNSVLLQTNINSTRGDALSLLKALVEVCREIEARLAGGGAREAKAFAARVAALMQDVPKLPRFGRFHEAFRDHPDGAAGEGRIREAFYLAADEANCEFVPLDSSEIDRRQQHGPALVSGCFVIPAASGVPILVPGQVITAEAIAFLRRLDLSDAHGYRTAAGLKLLKSAVLARRRSAA